MQVPKWLLQKGAEALRCWLLGWGQQAAKVLVAHGCSLGCCTMCQWRCWHCPRPPLLEQFRIQEWKGLLALCWAWGTMKHCCCKCHDLNTANFGYTKLELRAWLQCLRVPSSHLVLFIVHAGRWILPKSELKPADVLGEELPRPSQHKTLDLLLETLRQWFPPRQLLWTCSCVSPATPPGWLHWPYISSTPQLPASAASPGPTSCDTTNQGRRHLSDKLFRVILIQPTALLLQM